MHLLIHNVIRDPPFSMMSLVSCRNLLIYMNPELQERVIPVFHYALVPGGILLLGGSESVAHTRTSLKPWISGHASSRAAKGAVPR